MAKRSLRHVMEVHGGTAPAVPPVLAPTLVSVSPDPIDYDVWGNAITIIGTGFDETCTLLYGDFETAVTFVSATQLDAALWLDDFTYSIGLSVKRGEQVSNVLTVTVVGEPSLFGYSPEPIPAGYTGVVTITGNRLDEQCDLWLTQANKMFDPSTVTSPDHETLLVTAPAMWVAGSEILSVYSNTPGYYSNDLPITVAVPPPALSIASCTPNPVPAGYTGVVTITGTGFDAQCELWLLVSFDMIVVGPEMSVPNATTLLVTAPTKWLAGNETLQVYSNTLNANSNEFPITVAP